MKNFDDDRKLVPFDEEERRFVLGGETFTVKPRVRPEVLIPWAKVTTESSMEDDVANVDATLKGLLEPESLDRFEQLRARETDPVAYLDLVAVLRWAVEVTAGRPTKQPSNSGSGDGKNGTDSTAGQSLRAVEA